MIKYTNYYKIKRSRIIIHYPVLIKNFLINILENSLLPRKTVMNYPYKDKIEKIIVSSEFPHHYCITRGKKHHIISPNFYDYENMRGGELVQQVTFEEIHQYPLAQPVSLVPASLLEAANVFEARAFLLKDYRGSGVEFGAADNPLPLPLVCDVKYADLFSPDQGVNKFRTGEFVNINIKSSFDDMNDIENDSLDFLLGAHIIEHSPNPIEVIKKAHRKLKKGGRLFFVVPHMHYTFDKSRQLTSLEHLIQDFIDYQYNRDALNIMDFIGNTDPGVRDTIDAFGLCQKFLNKEPFDIHYHTFTEENFEAMLQWANQYSGNWESYVVTPCINPQFAEFYVEIIK